MGVRGPVLLVFAVCGCARGKAYLAEDSGRVSGVETTDTDGDSESTEGDDGPPEDTGNAVVEDTGNAEVGPGDTGEAAPGDTSDVVPGDTGEAAPGDTSDVVPGDTGEAAPDDTGEATPDDTGEVLLPPVEICDGLDNDGDGEVDEGFDVDADGVPDCFDLEECDGVDNDGDGEIDESGAYGETTWYWDADADGFGRSERAVVACDAPASTVADDSDCDDTDAGVFPGADEVCDGQDNDCDDAVDEGHDSDGDGTADCFDEEECDGLDNDGDGEIDEDAPDTDGDGIVDCMDEEECDGLDNDGDGVVDEGFDFTGDGSADCTDDDGDGYSEADGDCDDSRDDVYPDAPEIDDGIDNDCDGKDRISVLFELSHGEGTWSDPDDFDSSTGWGYAADVIEDMGADWGRLDEGPITAEALEGWDMLVIAEPTWAFAEDEIRVIEDYVAAGGGLLMTTDYNEHVINPVAEGFGATFTGSSSGWFTITDLAVHPITTDVDSVYIANGGSLDVSDDAEVVGWYGELDMIAASEWGAGGVVFVGDNEAFSYYAISFTDNDTFLERIVTWLARDL